MHRLQDGRSLEQLTHDLKVFTENENKIKPAFLKQYPGVQISDYGICNSGELIPDDKRDGFECSKPDWQITTPDNRKILMEIMIHRICVPCCSFKQSKVNAMLLHNSHLALIRQPHIDIYSPKAFQYIKQNFELQDIKFGPQKLGYRLWPEDIDKMLSLGLIKRSIWTVDALEVLDYSVWERNFNK